MKNNALDDLIKCNIEISSPAQGNLSFDSILVVVPPPTAVGKKPTAKVFAISSAEDLLEYGYTAIETAYKAATVVFSQNPKPSEIKICARGEVKSKKETITEVLNRAKAETVFYGVHISSFTEETDVQEAISWAEANEKLFCFEYTNIDKFPVKNTSFYRSFAIFSGLPDGYAESDTQPSENAFAALGWMAKCFGYEPGSETWAYKELAGIVPSALSKDNKNKLVEKNVSAFLRYAGTNITTGGKTLAGEWIDVIRFRDWIKNELQVSVFNILKVNRKVPYTDSGISLIEGAMESVLKKAQDIGGVSSTEYSADGAEIPGFTVSVPKTSGLDEATRKSRKLTSCEWTARLAGAIHIVEISGKLNF